MSDTVQRTKYAIYDPATGLFVGKIPGKMSGVASWTDKFDLIQIFAQPKQALDLLEWARAGSNSRHVARPGCEMVEMTITTQWSIKPFEFSRSETPEYQRAKAIYNEFLPQATTDPDALSLRDWKRFKTARLFLKKVGEIS